MPINVLAIIYVNILLIMSINVLAIIGLNINAKYTNMSIHKPR